MSGSTVGIGAHTDTAEWVYVTLTRKAGDTDSDYSSINAVVLLLPDGSTQAVTFVSATAGQWVGKVRYNAWFASASVYTTHARATFANGFVMTFLEHLDFSVAL